MTVSVNEGVYVINEKFYTLPSQRQKQIIDGALKVFSQSCYKKASTLEIAKEAGISKGLLFHYFINKKQLYLFLYQFCIKLSLEELQKNKDPYETDFFKLIQNSIDCKCRLIKKHAYLHDFTVRAYMEENKEIAEDVNHLTSQFIQNNLTEFFNRVDTSRLKDNVDVATLFNILNWCAEGFMKSKLQNKNINIDQTVSEFEKILNVFRQNFYKKESL